MVGMLVKPSRSSCLGSPVDTILYPLFITGFSDFPWLYKTNLGPSAQIEA